MYKHGRGPRKYTICISFNLLSRVGANEAGSPGDPRRRPRRRRRRDARSSVVCRRARTAIRIRVEQHIPRFISGMITTYYSRRNSVLYIVVWYCTVHCTFRYCVYSVVSRGRWRSLVDRRSHCAVSRHLAHPCYDQRAPRMSRIRKNKSESHRIRIRRLAANKHQYGPESQNF